MVWQLPLLTEEFLKESQRLYHQRQLAKAERHGSHSERDVTSSRTSSSLDLGPTPGSGVITVDSEGEDDANGAEKGIIALPEQFEPISTEDSYINWNRDVESLMNSAISPIESAQNAMDLISSVDGENGLRKKLDTPSPNEDFTQTIKMRRERDEP